MRNRVFSHEVLSFHGSCYSRSALPLHLHLQSWILFQIFLLLFMIYLSEGQEEVVATLRQDVTLQCRNPLQESISVLKWSRPDLNTYGYVYFYRNQRCYDNYQHPSFHGRVELKQADMAAGDASLILKNVTFNDTGTYECHISSRSPRRSRRHGSEISHFIRLSVTASDERHFSMREDEDEGGSQDGAAGGGSGVMVGAVGAAAVGAAAVGLVAFWRFRRPRKQDAVEHHADTVQVL